MSWSMKYLDYTIEQVELKDQPDKLLHEYCDFLDIGYRWYEQDDPLPNRDQRIFSIRNPHPHSKGYNWIVRDKQGIIVGSAGFGFEIESSPSFEQNGHTCGGGVEILPEHRRKGIATEILKQMLEIGHDQGKTVFNIGSSLQEGFDYCEQFLKGKIGQKGGENRLKIADLDWDLMKKWIAEGEERNPDTKLVFFEDCPDEIIDAYMEIYTETMNQQPMGDMDWRYKGTPESRREDEQRMKDHNTRWFTLISQEPDGSISGLTEMYYNTKRTFRIAQNLTGVRQIERGRGLGKWLKAEMVTRIMEMFPEITYISTGNADSNAPMLSINHRMGFKKIRTWQAYKFDLEELRKRLQEN